jgi:pimeloyl-ACP methyl ester carboxylesterase
VHTTYSLRVRIALALLAIVTLFTFSPKPVMAAHPTAQCSPDVIKLPTNAGKRVPVLFVHGVHANPGEWGSSNDPKSMFSLVHSIPGLYVDDSLSRFDYAQYHDDWIDNDNIGPKLARQIECIAQSSREQGGPGKVIVVAHSMGGLATRYAADKVIDGHKVADDLGLVVTIATPNTGTAIADWTVALLLNACHFGFVVLSGLRLPAPPDCLGKWRGTVEMRANVQAKVHSLPWLPKTVPVMAIAGNVAYRDPFLDVTLRGNGSDTIVPVESATAGANDSSRGGGVHVVKCDTAILIPFITDANCWHGNLPSNREVEDVVVDSIIRYLDAIHPPCPPSTGRCLGTRYADVDGDKLPDRTGITYDPTSVCTVGSAGAAPTDVCRITIYVVQGDGGYIVYPTQVSPHCYQVCSAKVAFLGLTPMNGPVNNIVISPFCPVYTCSFIAYQVRQGQVQLIQFLRGAAGQAKRLGDVGFTCRTVNGAYQVEALTAISDAPTDNTLDEVYQANAAGNMDLVSSKTVTDSAIPKSEMGPHCQGLRVPS